LTFTSAASSNTIFIYSSNPYNREQSRESREGGQDRGDMRKKIKKADKELTIMIPSILIAVFS
jgi:hypothetical protein